MRRAENESRARAAGGVPGRRATQARAGGRACRPRGEAGGCLRQAPAPSAPSRPAGLTMTSPYPKTTLPYAGAPQAHARKLVAGLGGERARWEAGAARLARAQAAAPGDAALACAFVAYAGPFPPAARDALVDGAWRDQAWPGCVLLYSWPWQARDPSPQRVSSLSKLSRSRSGRPDSTPARPNRGAGRGPGAERGGRRRRPAALRAPGPDRRPPAARTAGAHDLLAIRRAPAERARAHRFSRRAAAHSRSAHAGLVRRRARRRPSGHPAGSARSPAAARAGRHARRVIRGTRARTPARECCRTHLLCAAACTSLCVRARAPPAHA